jgi:SAM-dependent methyltransferase
MAFDPIQYKKTTRQQWEDAADAWHRGELLERWLGEATGLMLDATGVTTAGHVLDVAAGAGGQTIAAARRVGTGGRVLATDISPTILTYAAKAAAMRDVLRDGGRVGAIVYSTAERNQFFSVPVSIIRNRAQLPAPQPGQPGPFSLGDSDVLKAKLNAAGFRDVTVETLPAPVLLPSAADCVQFERDSFGALHQMLAGLTEAERGEVWQEIEEALEQFDTPEGFVGPCELHVVAATR